ncbi:MAG: hypothetical protein N3D14_00975 [Aquificaceae bacterium]|nr:hypothetical protein [Aquificaceae bacterium]MCX8163950.1 hypothetical protein [Aquificaceae bacterium]
MPSGKLFKEKRLSGKLGVYPFTPESLIRIGLALCVYLKIQKGLQKPKMVLREFNFATLSVGVGFMAGGGDVYQEHQEGDLEIGVKSQGEEISLLMEKIEDHELKMVESILFSRYNMPRAEGEEVGRIWIRGATP